MASWPQVSRRLATVARALGAESSFGATEETVAAGVAECFAAPARGAAYLLLAVLTLEIPLPHEVTAALRAWRRSGSPEWIVSLARAAAGADGVTPECEVRDGVVVDVTDTVASDYVTGIQRVVREVAAHWSERAPITTVSWDAPRRRLHEVSLDNAWRAGRAIPFVIPFGGTFVLPEIAVEGPRAARIATVAQHSGRSLAVGHDCIPLTTAETSGAGMPGAFAKYLAALAEFDEIATTSGASEAEFTGWAAMTGEGTRMPAISRVQLPTSGSPVSVYGEPEGTADGPAAGRLPLVLVVGSHEPRKNHLRVLDAAERLWQSGHRFELVMVGGNSWDAEEFTRTVAQLRAAGNPISILTSASDAELWTLYRRAEFSVFVSLNEGFGLPIGESITNGTPVVTSSFGSMAELGAGRGGRLVDPKSAEAIAGAMRELLDEPAALAALRQAADRAEGRTWAEYSAQLWERLTGA